MKQVSVFIYSSLLLIACTSGSGSSGTSHDTTATAGDSSTGNSVSYPYSISYSSDYSIGDPKHAQTVLSIWKDYDNNTLDAHKDDYADSLEFITPDGTILFGPRDSVLHTMTLYRASLAGVTQTVAAVVSLKPKGKEESWVSVWGKEIDTHKDNKVDSMNLHEDWMFDASNKIVYIQQQAQTFPKKK